VSDAQPNDRPPRGAIAVLAVGLLACVVAALLATDKGEGTAAQLEWVQASPLPDSKAAAVPGGGGRMRLTEAGLRATGTNVSGYELYRVAAVLRIDAGSPVGSARIHCSARGREGAEVAQTPGSRASYPRSSEELIKQGVPDNVLAEFTSHGAELALVEFGDVFDAFADERGIKLEWPAYKAGLEQWEWFLPPGPPSEPLELGFASVWRATGVPSAQIACTLATSAGSATVRTAAALAEKSEPLAE
jgi:hypothetical protein